MSIINRNYLVNKNKKGRDRSEKTGKRNAYYDKSCPKCGLPANDGMGGVLNKQSSPYPARNAKCVVCNSLLNEGKP